MLKRLHLFCHFVGDFWIAVAAVDNGYAGKAVEIFFARMVIKVLHGTFDELRRVGEEMTETRHDVFFLFFQTFFRAKIFSHKQDFLSFYCINKSVALVDFLKQYKILYCRLTT